MQIRTWEMHYTAEYGIAAHWKYKLGIHPARTSWRSGWRGYASLSKNQKDVDDAEDIINTIKTDLSSDDVFVFTPKGDVITLPVGATVIDFAYGNPLRGGQPHGRREGGRTDCSD